MAWGGGDKGKGTSRYKNDKTGLKAEDFVTTLQTPMQAEMLMKLGENQNTRYSSQGSTQKFSCHC